MVKKKVKVKFVDFARDFDITNNDFMDILSKYYDVEISENPEYLFYSVFGKSHIKYDCIKIFYTGECLVPNFNLCDYAIGFEIMEYGDRYVRVPLYQLFQYKDALKAAIDKSNISEDKRAFCSFVCSNDQGMPERKKVFELLSRYKKVDSGGRYLNNIGGPIEDKLEFDKMHKFSIAFENCVSEGYTTEKIIQAFAAGTIPIYFGNPQIEKEINPASFVNCSAFPTLEDAVQHVIEIDNNDKLYQKMLSEPIFVKDIPSLDELDSFLRNIFNQPLEYARRRPHNTRIDEVERSIRTIAFYDKIIGRKIQRFKGLIRRLKRHAL